MFESSVLFLELNSTKPSLIYDNLPQNPPPPRNRSENVASTFTMCSCDMRRNIDCEISTSFSGPLSNACHKHTSNMSINHRLRSRRPIGITSAFRIRKHTSDMSINHRLRSPRPIGITSTFRITYSLTYLQHADNTV